MTVELRPQADADIAALVALSLRAWAPVFASIDALLRPSGVYERLYDDWRDAQSAAVRAACEDATLETWVATVEDAVVGFVALRADDASGIGEIHMIAVDPPSQRAGIGGRLMEHATMRLQQRGMRVVMVETGGDEGHAPARALYERLGYAPLPITRYFLAV